MVCDEDESGRTSLWLLGVFMSILASTCTNLGVNLQKYSFMCEAKRKMDEKRSYTSQPKWMVGMLLVVIGGIGDFFALGFAPQTLITPVGGFTMVANVFFAHYFLNEAFNRRDAIATALIICGVIQVASFADKTAECYTLEELVSFYSRAAFISYAIVMVITCIFLLYLVRNIEHLLESFGPNSDNYAKFSRVHPILYPALSGLFGAQSTLFAKSTAELIKKTFDGDNQFTKYGTYFIACAMVTCIFLQIHWLAKGLQHFDAVFIVPVFQCFFITISIIGGGVYFDEFRRMSMFQIAMFLIGVIVTLAGVFLLSYRKMNQLKPKQKFRAWVHMIIFIKRLQKDSGIHHQWDSELDETKAKELEHFISNEVLPMEADEIEIKTSGEEVEITTSSSDLDHPEQNYISYITPHDDIVVMKAEVDQDDSETELVSIETSSFGPDEKSVLIQSRV